VTRPSTSARLILMAFRETVPECDGPMAPTADRAHQGAAGNRRDPPCAGDAEDAKRAVSTRPRKGASTLVHRCEGDPHPTPGRAVLSGADRTGCGDSDGTRSPPPGNERAAAVPVIYLMTINSALGARKSLRPEIEFSTLVTWSSDSHAGEPTAEQTSGDRIGSRMWRSPSFAERAAFMLALMYANGFSALTSNLYYGNRVGSYYDPVSRYDFVIARPSEQPELWMAYLGGARTSYRRFGVERVLEYDRTRDGTSTALFFAAVDGDGQVAGGMRAQGPYLRAGQAHALVEWAGRDGAAALHAEISERIPAGVIEMKTGWVRHDAPRRVELTAALARVFVHSMALLNVRHALGTVAAHAVARWQTTGGVVSSRVAPVGYPDGRYLTSPMWWDRETFADLAAAEQLPRLIDESAQLCDVDRPGLSAPAA
jgi:hypothetical protein